MAARATVADRRVSGRRQRLARGGPMDWRLRAVDALLFRTIAGYTARFGTAVRRDVDSIGNVGRMRVGQNYSEHNRTAAIRGRGWSSFPALPQSTVAGG